MQSSKSRLKPLSRLLSLALAGGLCASGAWAQEAAAPSAPAPAEPVTNSPMDAPLFYQLLIGEMELQSGQPGVAFQVLLDAARRTRDDDLFKRVVNIALQARAGDQALIAAQAWRDSRPDTIEAQQMTLQLMALLNRPAEAVEPLKALLRLTPADQRAGALVALPRLFQRSPEPKRVLLALAPLLQAQMGPLRPAALFAHARLAINAGESATALGLTRELAVALPDSDDAVQLALELLPAQPEAEALIRDRLQAQPDQHALRQGYARALARAQRPVDSAREFRALTVATPDNPAPWLALGALEIDLRDAAAAESALREALKRLDNPANGNADELRTRAEGRQQAWLLLSQAAEQRGDLKAAETWLQKVEGASLEVQYRRASLLARQGKLTQARKLLQVPEDASDEEARQRLLAEAQLLREQRDWKSALTVLEGATAERFKNDPDLIYEQAMLAERLGQYTEMEGLLRQVIELKGDHFHAYNALGYSLADRNIRLDEAKGLIQRALKLSPAEAVIVDSLGWVEYRLGNFGEAAKLLQQAHAARPDAEIAAHLGEVLWAIGKQDDARRVWQEASVRDPRNEALRETLERLKVKP
jgi:tetratricopeptide (TPR) repeat protein